MNQAKSLMMYLEELELIMDDGDTMMLTMRVNVVWFLFSIEGDNKCGSDAIAVRAYNEDGIMHDVVKVVEWQAKQWY